MARYGVSSEKGFYLIVVCGAGYLVERIETKHPCGGCTYEDKVVTNEHFVSRHENKERAANFVSENCDFQERWNEYHRVFNSHIFIPLYVSVVAAYDIKYWSGNFVNEIKKGGRFVAVSGVVPLLKALGFPALINAQQMYQNVSMWAGQQLSCEPPVTISNESKVEKTGFNKQSFRRQKCSLKMQSST
jgi:hypothetical protein